MIKKIIASVVVVLALGAGVAYAATQFAASNGTEVCVNNTNGLVRVSSSCRDGEHAMTIGGGSNAVVTSSGTFTVTAGGASTPKTLPLTGVTISGSCGLLPASPPNQPVDVVQARLILAASIGTMDAFVMGGNTLATMGGTSLTTSGPSAGLGVGFGGGSAVVTANAATATLVFGEQANPTTTPKTCVFLWQATEAPN
jgi:hypothetical protein